MPSNIDESKLIRKLGLAESFFDNEALHGNMIQTRALLTKVSQQHVIDRPTLNKAIEIWTKRHPILRAKIHRTLDESDHKPKSTLPKHLVFLDKPIDEYDNVELTEIEDESAWIECFKKEIKANLDHENGPLWKMKVVKIKNSQSSNKYLFLLKTNHAISDGRNGFMVVVQFLNILGALLENSTCEEMNGQVEDEFKSLDDLLESYVKNPGYKSLNKEDKPFYDFMTNRMTRKAANEHGSNSQFELMQIESEKLNKLHKKMKENAPQCKLTALLALVICKSLKATYLKYGIDDIPLDNFQMVLASALRDRLKVSYTQMGCYIANLMLRFGADQFEEGDFWKNAETLSNQIHHYLEFNEDIVDPDVVRPFYEMADNGHDFSKHDTYNTALTNIGVMKNTSTELIKITEHYMCVPAIEKRLGSSLVNSMSTISSNLFWCISYNEIYFKSEFVKDYKADVLAQIDKLVLSVL